MVSVGLPSVMHGLSFACVRTGRKAAQDRVGCFGAGWRGRADHLSLFAAPAGNAAVSKADTMAKTAAMRDIRFLQGRACTLFMGSQQGELSQALWRRA